VTIDDRERSLVCVPDEKYQIHQLDRDLDGIYDMILVVRTTGLELLDVLVFEKAGYLRHASKEEFETRLAIANRNKQALEELDKITQEAFKKFNKQGLPLSPQATSVK
jgi:hypothetical protein